ncbi:hypothetical protein FOA43_002938 [Brettanomyces nanus]|uniref:Endonuclease/exonuclease/phosphatase domain-containing protein n=1 Tax=Eeniella nana TaxID=13502 RepID=A0A875S1G7_EENNA|nr:uncharacterized protein FOA43_002938 [Brettanomyces nanus]QPG75581.1 hypothetical protein FOA43_002938 [Brettanomyces nanus]
MVLLGIKKYSSSSDNSPVENPVAPIAAHVRFQSWNLRNDAISNDETINDTISNLNSTIPYDTDVRWYSQYKEVAWSTRRIGVANEVSFNRPDLFTVNEALSRQVEDLTQLLSPMKYVGVGRDDGDRAGEFQAIFYDPYRVELLNWDTFWMSQTPFKPSKFPGAGSTRSATVGHFRNIRTGFDFVLINLHLDDQSDDQRRLGAAMARLRGAHEFEKHGCPVFLVGDFNSQSQGGSSGAYSILTGVEKFNESLIDHTFLKRYGLSRYSETFAFDDLLKSCKPERRTGNLATFTNFLQTTDGYSRIDFQFGGNPHIKAIDKMWQVERYRVGENWFDNSYFLSDHRPVVSDVMVWN